MFGAYNAPNGPSGLASAEATPPASQQLSSLSAEPSYFPPVPTAPTSRSGSTSSGATSSAGDASLLAAPADISAPPSRSTTPIVAPFDQLRISTPEPDKGLQVGWADSPLSVPSVDAGRRKSFVTAGEVDVARDANSKALNIRRRFEGDSERRASFESSDSRPRPVFGTSSASLRPLSLTSSLLMQEFFAVWATKGSAVE